MKESVVGDIVSIIENKESQYYDGNLVHYFNEIIYEATNLANPYHNLRHMLHVTWLCYDAVRYYVGQGILTTRQARNVLIAAMFHDFNHSGHAGADAVEINRAIEGLKDCIDDEDVHFYEKIVDIIVATEYPHRTPVENLTLSQQILRDADSAQCFSSAWMQQVLCGLAAEQDVSFVEMLQKQEPFLRNLHFGTNWAKERFHEVCIRAKIREVHELLRIIGC